MLLGCGCHCGDASEYSNFSSVPPSAFPSFPGQESVIVPSAGCAGCLDSVAPTQFTLQIDYTGASSYTDPGTGVVINWPCCQFYSLPKQYTLKRQASDLPELQHCCFWESDERAVMYDETQPPNKRCAPTPHARAFAIVWSPLPAGGEDICPHNFALQGEGNNYGPWHIATGLRFLYRQRDSLGRPLDPQSTYIWYGAGNRTVVSGVNCLANIQCDFIGDHWDIQQTKRKWSSGWMRPFWEPCYNVPHTSGGVPQSVTLLAAGA